MYSNVLKMLLAKKREKIILGKGNVLEENMSNQIWIQVYEMDNGSLNSAYNKCNVKGAIDRYFIENHFVHFDFMCLFVCGTLFVSLFIHKIVCRNMNKSRSRFTVNCCVPFSFEPPAKKYAHMLCAFHSKCDFTSDICLPFFLFFALSWKISVRCELSFENKQRFGTSNSNFNWKCIRFLDKSISS